MDGIGADDQTLVSQVLGGERESFAPLVDRYRRPVLHVALRIVSDPEEARDVAQSVFLKVFEKLHSFNPRYRFFSWLYRIAVNESLNAAARNRRLQDAVDIDRFASTCTPEDLFRSKEVRRNLHAALDALAPNYRSVIVLRHLCDCSYREIGESLGIPEKTVKSRLFSARRQLQESLKKRLSAPRPIQHSAG